MGMQDYYRVMNRNRLFIAVVAVLAAALSQAFPEIEVIISKTHHDCMEFA